MPLSDLTDSQQAAFRARLAQAGIDPADVVSYVGPDSHPGQLRAAGDPEQSTIRPHLLELANVDELAELTGIPDEHYESGLMEEHHEIPEALPGHRVLTKDTVSAADRNAVHQAHLVWL